MRQWKILHSDPMSSRATPREIVSLLLRVRGIVDPSIQEAYLSPSLSTVTVEAAGISSESLEKALTRISRAIKEKEPITVYTDYDVDGVSAGAIIWETLYHAGAKVMPYIPHREKEGYGLSRVGIDTIKKEQNTSLLITVDHGITAKDHVAYARSVGMDVIILDHHVLPDELPDAYAIVHTTKLCSGGIAWIVAREFRRAVLDKKSEDFPHYLDLAALATIADLVPMVGINRVLVAEGLKQLRKSDRIGLRALVEDAGMSAEEIDVYQIGHHIAPRINAMGRITHALDALRLLCTTDTRRAQTLAKRLSTKNRERQVLTEDAMTHAKEHLPNHKAKKILIVSDASYNQGVIGLVAGRLVQEYYKPAIVIAVGEKYCKASARSVSGCNIIELIHMADDLLVDAGGHPMAAGFTVETKHLTSLIAMLEDIAQECIDDDLLVPRLSIDLALSYGHISEQLVDVVNQMSPFGVGNPQPVFATMKMIPLQSKRVGKQQEHIKLLLQDAERKYPPIDAIGFRQADMFSLLSPQRPIDVAYTVEKNTWNGTTRLQLLVKDIRMSG